MHREKTKKYSTGEIVVKVIAQGHGPTKRLRFSYDIKECFSSATLECNIITAPEQQWTTTERYDSFSLNRNTQGNSKPEGDKDKDTREI